MTFDSQAWEKMRNVQRKSVEDNHFFGSDRDAGAIKISSENATRAGVEKLTEFKQQTISALIPPTSASGLVILNPPYGSRIGDKKKLSSLYKTLGDVLLMKFSGWRIGIITTDKTLAYKTGLPFLPTSPPIQHGGLRVTLFQTNPLP